MRLQPIDRTGSLQALFNDPALGALLASTEIGIGETGNGLDVRVDGPGRVTVSQALTERDGAGILLRFALEQAWMLAVPGVSSGVATLLGARAAGCFLRILPRAAQVRALEDPAIPGFDRLSAPVADAASLVFAARHVAGAATDPAELALVQRLWRFAQPLEALLIDGGDERLSLDPVTGRNRYLCVPYPDPDCIRLGSCTASSPSVAAYAAAESRRQALFAAAVAEGGLSAVRAASAQVTGALLAYFLVEDLAEAVLAASGTDATLLLTGLLAAEHPGRRIDTILMSPSETGSGVPDAVLGQHFASSTASGMAVLKGGAVEGFPPTLACRIVRLRDEEGRPRDAAALAADCDACIADIVRSSGHAVLHAIDGSKTGLMGPDRDTCRRLAARFGGGLDIVIDACQARIEPDVVRGYLEQGFPVLVSGSKFFAAPGFCGAILFPRARLRRIAGGGRLPEGLGAYADLTEDGVSRRCPGLLLRWEAALEEMRRFADVPAATLRATLDRMGTQIRAAIMRDDRWLPIYAPRPEGAGWSHRSSVFTFAIRAAGGWLSAAALRPLYGALSLPDQRCLIGQPVEVAPGLGGLRIALSAAQLAGDMELKAELGAVFSKLHLLLEKPIAG